MPGTKREVPVENKKARSSAPNLRPMAGYFDWLTM